MERAILGVCRGIISAIDRERRRLDGLNDALARLTAALDGLPRGGGYRSRLDALTAAALDAERGVRELQAILVICQVELGELLDAAITDVNQREVLFRRYGRCLPFAAIAAEMAYSLRHVYTLHGAGLRAYARA